MSLLGTLIGVVSIQRHGSRTKFYQDPSSYTASSTEITPFGEQQAYQLGEYYRGRYVQDGASNQIQGISSDKLDMTELTVQADAAAEANVIVLSVYNWLQGVYPPSSSDNVTLANGTTVVTPGGLQYAPIATIEGSESPLLEPWLNCPNYDAALKQLYNSTSFAVKANASSSLIKNITKVTGHAAAGLKDMYNVYDYFNVNWEYNATFRASTTSTTLAQARDLANWLTFQTFAGPSNTSFPNIAGRGVLGNIITSMRQVANTSTNQKIQHFGLSYKPFTSLFSILGASSSYPELQGIVNYASLLAFEVRQSSGKTYINMVFRNGTDPGVEAIAYPILGRDQVALDDFVTALNSTALYSTIDWCRTCGQSGSIEQCGALLLAANASTTSTSMASNASGASAGSKSNISPIGAGFIGAAVALVVTAVFLSCMPMALGLRVVRRRKADGHPGTPLDTFDQVDHQNIVVGSTKDSRM
ncbi:hypothetical protein PYCC9005_000786 [Savitreella phatthalungensis]